MNHTCLKYRLIEEKVINAIDNVINRTKNNQNGILNICINYGACEEIIDATLKIHKLLAEKKLTEDSINRKTFSKYLYNDLPAIDLLIRTGGEKRLYCQSETKRLSKSSSDSGYSDFSVYRKETYESGGSIPDHSYGFLGQPGT